MPELTIVIVSWNARRFVQKCLSSLQAATIGLDTEVFVIDNASSDGTPELIEQQFPKIKLIRNPMNAGFAAANNIGIVLSRGKYVALINSDVEVPAGCLQKMICYLDRYPSVGMLGPKMLTSSGSAAPSCMRRPSLRILLTHALGLASFLPNLNLHVQNPESLGTQSVDVLNGWFWLVRKEALDQVGLLDERFFMYGEDIDWCHRFWNGGWKVVYFPDAEAVHYGGASSARAPVRFYIEMQRANLQYWRRYHGLISQTAFLLIILLHQACHLLGYAVVFALIPRLRAEASFKCQRSAACLRWLFLPSALVAGGKPACC